MDITLFTSGGIEKKSLDELPALLAADDGGVLWVNVGDPSDEDARMMSDIFHFHPLSIEDTRNHKQRPKIEEYPGYLFLIFNPVSMIDDELDFHELDIFVGRNYVVTAYSAAKSVVEEAQKRISHSGALTHISVSYALYALLDTVVDGYFPIVDMVEEEINTLEDMILSRPRQESLARIFALKRMLLHLWRVVWPEREILSSLSQPHMLSFADKNEAQYYMRDVSDHLFRIAEMVGTFRDTLTSVIDLYMSSVSNRLNRVVNRLTVITLTFGVFAVITGFYGMNFLQTWPPFSSDWGVPFVLGLMAIVAAVAVLVLTHLDDL